MQCVQGKKLAELFTKETGIKLAASVGVAGLICYFKLKPIGILLYLILGSFLARTFYSQYTLEVPAELTTKCQLLFDNFKCLRKNKPNVFCGFVSSSLLLVALVGHLINGTWLLVIFLMLSVLVSTKYNIRIVKEQDDATAHQSADNVEDEFLPRLDSTNLLLLTRVGEDADSSAIYSKSLTSSKDSDEDEMMLPKDAVLPSIEDADNDDNEFMPEFIKPPRSDVLTKGQQYKSKHFKTNSSSSSSFGSEDEDSITSGLDFSTVSHTVVDHAYVPAAQTTPASQLAWNLLDKVLPVKSSHTKIQPPKSRQLSDDDSSDFEILEKEDLST